LLAEQFLVFGNEGLVFSADPGHLLVHPGQFESGPLALEAKFAAFLFQKLILLRKLIQDLRESFDLLRPASQLEVFSMQRLRSSAARLRPAAGSLRNQPATLVTAVLMRPSRGSALKRPPFIMVPEPELIVR